MPLRIFQIVFLELCCALLLRADAARLRLRCRVACTTELGGRGELCTLLRRLAAPSTCVTLEATTNVGDLV